MQGAPADTVDHGANEELLGLFDAIWFGVQDAPDSPRPSRVKSSTYTADPLDSVIPVVGYAALLPGGGMQPSSNGLVLTQQQQPYQQLFEQAAAGSASFANSSQQQLHQQQQHLQQAHYQQYSAAQQVHQASGAVPAPSQPRPMWVPAGGGTAGRPAYASSPTTSPQQQQQPQQEQQQKQQGLPAQQQQQGSDTSPFVLGTWAQRQYIMPLQRPAEPPQSPGPSSLAEQSVMQRGSSSPARPILRGKLPSSNGSSNSSTSTRGKAAGGHTAAAQHSSSGGSSEPPPPAGAQQAAAEAAAAAAGARTDAAVHGDDAAAAALWNAAAAAEAETVAAAARGARRSLGTDEEEEAVQQIAWRWRFQRRWQAEQTRGPQDPAAPASPGDGGMEEALQYLAACGENWQHLSRESSRLGTVESRLLGTLGSLGCLGSELLADESFSAAGSGFCMQPSLLQDTADSGGVLAAACAEDSRQVSMSGDSSSDGQPQQAAEQEQQLQLLQQQQAQQQQQQRRRHKKAVQPRGEATVEVTGITKKAQELLAAQKDFNRAAQERWQQVSSKQGSSMWVGALLEGVQVDPWGKFKFLLMRVRDRNTGRQVLLVRGANNCSESGIVEDLHKQMVATCSEHNLPVEAVEVMGGGVMEWTKHRDRHLHISGGYVSRSGGPGGPVTGIEVMRLAAVLTQQALPMHYKVTSEGDGKKL